MENKKKVPSNTVTRDIKNLAAPTGNIYESVVILYKRANQIAVAEKKELMKKLDEFRGDRDTMEEVFENKEQIEISKYYERQPKPDLVAISEFEAGELFYRKAQNEAQGPEEDGLAGAGLSGYNDETLRKINFQRVDQYVVPDVEGA